MKKSIDTLVEDIYKVVSPDSHHPMSRDILESALKDISHTLCQTTAIEKGSSYYIRPSSIGKGLRWHYFMNKYPDQAEAFDGRMKLLFQSGHIYEAVILAYVKLAGYEVTHQQAIIDLNGVTGSCDCLINGYLIDVKTTSDYSFKKFSEGEISLDNDPFGYIAQLSTYKQGLVEAGVEVRGQGWLAYNKNNSNMVLHLIPDSELIDAPKKIEDIREAHKAKHMPEELCPGAEPVAEKNGNEQMGFTCGYCPFKEKCFPDFKVYRYSNKDKFYTHIEKEPRVQEVTNEYRN